MRQPGSLRDSAESFSKIAITSDSRPTFAIQVTANTTIRRSVLSLSVDLGSCRWALQAQLAYEVGDPNRLLTIGARGNQSHPRSGFLFDEGQVIAGGLGQCFDRPNGLRWAGPAGHIAVDTLDLFITACLRRNFVRFLAVHLIPHADWNLRQVVEHIQLSNHQPGDTVNHASVTAVSYTHLRAHETRHDLVCRLLLE